MVAEETYKQMNGVLSKQLARQARRHRLTVAELRRDTRRCHETLGSVADHRNVLAGELAEAEADLARQRGHYTGLCGHLGKVRRQLDTACGAVRELTQERDAMEKALKEVQEQGTALAKELERTQREKDAQAQTIGNYQRELTTYKGMHATQRSTIAKYQAEVRDLRQELILTNAGRRQLNEVEADLHGMEADRDNLLERLNRTPVQYTVCLTCQEKDAALRIAQKELDKQSHKTFKALAGWRGADEDLKILRRNLDATQREAGDLEHKLEDKTRQLAKTQSDATAWYDAYARVNQTSAVLEQDLRKAREYGRMRKEDADNHWKEIEQLRLDLFDARHLPGQDWGKLGELTQNLKASREASDARQETITTLSAEMARLNDRWQEAEDLATERLELRDKLHRELEALKQCHGNLSEERQRCYIREQRLKSTMGNAARLIRGGAYVHAEEILNHTLCDLGYEAPTAGCDLVEAQDRKLKHPYLDSLIQSPTLEERVNALEERCTRIVDNLGEQIDALEQQVEHHGHGTYDERLNGLERRHTDLDRLREAVSDGDEVLRAERKAGVDGTAKEMA